MKPTLSLTVFALALLCLILLPLFAHLCVYAQSARSSSTVMPIGKPVQIKAPLGLPPVPIPPDNPPTEETIALGRRLYYDPELSVDGTISCASCHAPQFAFSDNRPVSKGVGGKPGTRHALTVINSGSPFVARSSGRREEVACFSSPRDLGRQPLDVATVNGGLDALKAKFAIAVSGAYAMGVFNVTVQ